LIAHCSSRALLALHLFCHLCHFSVRPLVDEATSRQIMAARRLVQRKLEEERGQAAE